MSDIVKRLRADGFPYQSIKREAADEIERLKEHIGEHQSRDALQQMEIERLKAVVEHCAVVRLCSKCAAALEDDDE